MVAILAWSRDRGSRWKCRFTYRNTHLINFLCKTTIAYLSELIGNFLRGASNLKIKRRIGSFRANRECFVATVSIVSSRMSHGNANLCTFIVSRYCATQPTVLYFPRMKRFSASGFIVSLCTNFTREGRETYEIIRDIIYREKPFPSSRVIKIIHAPRNAGIIQTDLT